MTALWIIRTAACLAAFSVVCGAFAAHGLKHRVSPEYLAIFHTAVLYQFFHALALLLCGVLWQQQGLRSLWPVGLFIGGVVLFSGSLYMLVLTGVGRWGAVTPLGGLAFVAGWVVLACKVRFPL